MKTVLVTGGAGFIGSHLCEELLKRGDKVICVDNLSTGFYKNIEPFFRKKNFEFIEHDMKRPIYIQGLNEIYHLASPASPKAYLKDPVGTLRVNSEGTRNALEIASHGAIKFLLASTSEIYGDPKESPQVETYYGNVSTTGERSCYDEGKRYAEAIVMAYHRTTGLDSRIARIFNTYGPRMDTTDGRAIPYFLFSAKHSNILAIFGDGKQTRSFCYITDLIDGLIKLMASNEHMPVNLGNPQELTILELATKIIALSKSTAKIAHHAPMEDDPRQRRPDIKRAKTLLGWEPRISLSVGLKRLIKNND